MLQAFCKVLGGGGGGIRYNGLYGEAPVYKRVGISRAEV